MHSDFRIHSAQSSDAPEVAAMVGELLAEITHAIGEQVFHFDLAATTGRLQDFIQQEKYFVFIARDAAQRPLGFISLVESYALYAEGAFGTIPELYVRPAQRVNGVGTQLLAQVRAFAAQRGWKRMEVTTPPLPQFERTLAFYQREGFAISGGRKLKTAV